MLHPVGSEPPSVYWRRRLIVLGAVALVIVLIALTVSAITGGSGSTQAGGPSTSPTTRPSRSTSTSPSSAAVRTSSSASSARSSGTSGSPSSSTTATPAKCDLSDLRIAAVVGKSTYPVGANLLVELQVTNIGAKPCVQDLSDKQIELRVYNGASRVWGSHDCAVQPGTDLRTLAVGQPYRSAVQWGGLTSQPNCTQTARQRIGAGSYTLYAALAGKTGAAAQFSVS